jgi:hypothetical protein
MQDQWKHAGTFIVMKNGTLFIFAAITTRENYEKT